MNFIPKRMCIDKKERGKLLQESLSPCPWDSESAGLTMLSRTICCRVCDSQGLGRIRNLKNWLIQACRLAS
jgi:hypothetical protein